MGDYYCPYCGYQIDPQIIFVNIEEPIDCKACNNTVKFQKFLHEPKWYSKESFRRFGDHGKSWMIKNEEAIANPLYGTKKRKELSDSNTTTSGDDVNIILEAKRKQQAANSNLPKCPTCGSTNISKLSTVNRAVHGAAFGLFSKTARSQWKCNNCGNLW